MNLRMVNLCARESAHFPRLSMRGLCGRRIRAMVIGSATVPSCYMADKYKTCYPSPSTRLTGSASRPRFFADLAELNGSPVLQPEIGVGAKARGYSTGDNFQCGQHAQSEQPQRFSLRHSPWRAVTAQTLNAAPWAQASVASRRRLWAAVSAPACLSVRPAARSATTSISAEPTGLAPNTSIRSHRRAPAPGGFFASRRAA